MKKFFSDKINKNIYEVKKLQMPSTYAHRLFGEKMLELYPEKIRAVCKKNISLYNIGLHGPDILFYYKPLKPNPIQQIGYDLHSQSGKIFFNHAAKAVNCKKYDGAYLAYALGFICHYALDKACHGYIENKIAVSKVKHTEIESEFDKYLIAKAGKDPFKEDLVSHISFNGESSEIIARFFDGLSKTGARVYGKHIYKALKSVMFYNRLMQGKNPFKRGIVNFSLKISGNYLEMHGMMFSKKNIAKCEDSSLRLEKLFKSAQKDCLALTDEFVAAAQKGAELSDSFLPTFGPAEGWEKIPVFDTEGEKKYEVEA